MQNGTPSSSELIVSAAHPVSRAEENRRKMDYGWHMLSPCLSRVNKLKCHFDVTFFCALASSPSGDIMRNETKPEREKKSHNLLCHFLSKSFKVNCVYTNAPVGCRQEKCLHSHVRRGRGGQVTRRFVLSSRDKLQTPHVTPRSLSPH